MHGLEFEKPGHTEVALTAEGDKEMKQYLERSYSAQGVL